MSTFLIALMGSVIGGCIVAIADTRLKMTASECGKVLARMRRRK